MADQDPVENTEIDNDLGPVEIPQVETPPKPRRGRPPKDPNSVKTEKVDKETSSTVKARRKTTYDPQLLSKQLFGLHMMVAQVTGIPEAVLSNDDSMMLANSVIGVAEQYDLSIDGKTGAAIQLLATAAMVYMPRLLAIKRRAAEAAAQVVDVVPNN